jgi:hypothetical protein
VEWYRVRSYNANPYVRISFQAKLFETSNIIEFHYGGVETGTHNSGESASIGLEDATGGPNHFVEATTGSMTTPVTDLSSETNWPATNYRFTPNPFLHFYNLLVNKANTSLTVNFDVNIHGDITVNAGSILDVPASKKINILNP